MSTKSGHYCGTRTGILGDSTFTDGIRTSLENLVEQTKGFRLELPSPDELTETPNKPNFARMVAKAFMRNEQIGDLYVIVFMPGDGTGDTESIRPDSLTMAPGLIRAPKTNPRVKSSNIDEAHFALGTMDEGNYTVGANSLSLLSPVYTDDGLNGELVSIADLGMSPEQYIESVTTNTDHNIIGNFTLKAGRFGETHAVYNPWDAVQVAAFLGVNANEHGELLQDMGVIMPNSPGVFPNKMYGGGSLKVEDVGGQKVVYLTGRNPAGAIINHGCDNTYTVAPGSREATFYVDGELHTLVPSETISIPRGIPYYDKSRGTSRLIAVSSPHYNPATTELLRPVR